MPLLTFLIHFTYFQFVFDLFTYFCFFSFNGKLKSIDSLESHSIESQHPINKMNENKRDWGRRRHRSMLCMTFEEPARAVVVTTWLQKKSLPRDDTTLTDLSIFYASFLVAAKPGFAGVTISPANLKFSSSIWLNNYYIILTPLIDSIRPAIKLTNTVKHSGKRFFLPVIWVACMHPET